MEEEIKELKGKNEKLEEANKLLKESINNRETKFWNKVVKLIVLAVAVSIIFIGINNLSNKYYIYKIINPTKDCCDIEKNYAIKESESQKKIAELQKEICSLKSKTTETKKETSSSKTTKTQTY